MKKKIDLTAAFAAYHAGGNVTQHLRSALGEELNSDEIIEVAYDLQAGSYVKAYQQHRETILAYVEDLAPILARCAAGMDSVLDVGTGECTTLSDLSTRCFADVERSLACDISWSRLHVGSGFVRERLSPELASRLELLVASFFNLPLTDKSVDVIWSSHALEPNGGREREALAEIFRVARRRVCLFEPNYEANSEEGRARMDRLGYVRGLPQAIQSLGGQLDECIRIEHPTNLLNPTYAFVITPPDISSASSAPDDIWACPTTGHEMRREPDIFYCERAGLAYPILRGIPVLKPAAAILATALSGRRGG